MHWLQLAACKQHIYKFNMDNIGSKELTLNSIFRMAGLKQDSQILSIGAIQLHRKWKVCLGT